MNTQDTSYTPPKPKFSLNRRQRRNLMNGRDVFTGFKRKSRRYIQRVPEMGFLIEDAARTWKRVPKKIKKLIAKASGHSLKELESLKPLDKTFAKIAGARAMRIPISFRFKKVVHQTPWESPKKPLAHEIAAKADA